MAWPRDPITLRLSGVAGQSFGAWNAGGLHLYLEGDANDYVGKGMAGGRIVLRPPHDASFVVCRGGFVRLGGGRVTFSCVPKRKEPKKGHPTLAPDFVRCPALLAGSGRRELAHPCARTCAPFPRARLRCSAPETGGRARAKLAALRRWLLIWVP
jgi:hypothetical protein